MVAKTNHKLGWARRSTGDGGVFKWLTAVVPSKNYKKDYGKPLNFKGEVRR